eukprot:gene11869-12945_t
MMFLLVSYTLFLMSSFIQAVFSYPARPVGNYLAVDLGSRFMRFGVYRDGQVEVIPNKLGQRQTTSAVTYRVNDSTPLIVEDNWNILDSNTTTFMIASFYERMEKQEKAYFSMNDDIRQSLTRGVKDLLAFAKGEAVNYLQESVPNVVLTIPSFTYYQGRQILQDAAQQAGFTNSYFITAPAAVALAYTQLKPSKESENHQTILQVDFGFHHLHVSINLLHKNESTVIAAVKKSVGGVNVIASIQKYYESQLLRQGISETNLAEIHLKYEAVITGAVLQSGILSIENEDYLVNLNVTDVLQWDVNIKHAAITSILKIPRASILPISSEVNDVDFLGFPLMSMYVNGISLRGGIALPYINETNKSETCNVQFEINASNEGKITVTNSRSKQSKISTFKL